MTAPLIACWAAVVFLGLIPQDIGRSLSERDKTDSLAPPTYLDEMRFLDCNHDRRIDERELAQGQQMAAMILTLSWEECDSNGDGGISVDEFEHAAAQSMSELLEMESETDTDIEQQAEEDLAGAVPVGLLLERLASQERYADEVAALREAVEDLDDDDAVVTHIVANPKRYPHLTPAVRTWVRHYPVRPELRRHVKHPHWRYYRPTKAKPHKPVKPTVKPASGKKPPKVNKPPKNKPVKKPARGAKRSHP